MQKLHFPITQRAGSATCPDRSQGVRNAKINKKSDRQQGYASGRVFAELENSFLLRVSTLNKKRRAFARHRYAP